MMMKKTFALLTWILLTAAIANGQTDTFHLDETYPLDANGTILLQSDDAEVTITGSTRDNVHVVVNYKLETDGLSFGDYEPFEMKVWVEDGNLYLEEQPREIERFIIGDTDETYEIIIEAPKSVSLKLQGDDESYEIKNIDGEIRIAAGDATVTCTDCNGRYFAYRLDDGTIRMNSGRGVLKVSFGDGSININNSAFKKIKIMGDDSSIKIENKVQPGGSYQFSLGDASLELDLTEGRRSGAIKVGISADDAAVTVRTALKSGDEYGINAGDAAIQFYSVSGGGTFYINHDDASISTASGYQILINREGMSKYRLNSGGAAIKINVDDASINLH